MNADKKVLVHTHTNNNNNNNNYFYFYFLYWFDSTFLLHEEVAGFPICATKGRP
jgi:hypothetical protein